MRIYNRIPITLIENYIFSNVPAYLFDKFQADPFVIDLSRENTTKELISLFKQVQKRNKKSIKKLVVLYAILIAITIKNDIDSPTIISSLSISDLKWGKEIVRLYDQNRKPTNFFTPTLQIINKDKCYSLSEASEDQVVFFSEISQISQISFGT